MERLGLRRDPTRDFQLTLQQGNAWEGLVWYARRPGKA